MGQKGTIQKRYWLLFFNGQDYNAMPKDVQLSDITI